MKQNFIKFKAFVLNEFKQKGIKTTQELDSLDRADLIFHIQDYYDIPFKKGIDILKNNLTAVQCASELYKILK